MGHRWTSLPPRFWSLFSTLLLAGGLGLMAWGVSGSLGGFWLVMDVPIAALDQDTQRGHLVAGRDLIYEVELAYPAPPNESARADFRDRQKDRVASGVRWSVHNPRGRVATGTDGEVVYVVQEHTRPFGRLKSLLLGSPFLPPPTELPAWLLSGPGTILVGIGQWRARTGQSYDIDVTLDDGASPDPQARFRVRARRLSWQEHIFAVTPRVYAGALLVLLAILVWVARRLTAGRLRG
jgi:hypothetical protein